MSANLKFLSGEGASRLEREIPTNLPNYRSGKTASLIKESELLTSKIVAGDPPALLNSDGSCKTDADAAVLVHRWLSNLTPVQASDKRLWTWLAHGPFADYVFIRWKSGLADSEHPADRVLERWFFRGRGVATFVRSAIARLWWFAELTRSNDSGEDPYKLTPALLRWQDMQQAFLERSFGRSRTLLHCVLQTAMKNADGIDSFGNRSELFKAWAKALNTYGGSFILEAVPPDRLRYIVERHLLEQLT
jgi:hypothetical protein